MKNDFKNIIFILITAFLSWGVQAQGFDFDFNDRGFDRDRSDRRELSLDLRDQVFRGQQVIPLKQIIRRQYPRLNMRDLTLKRVVLLAKSRGGRGQASLFAGGETSFSETIPGNPNEFDSNRPRSFYRVALRASQSRRGPQGPWQVNLRGNNKISAIKVVVRGRGGNGGGGRPPRVTFQHIDSMRVEKFLSKTKIFSINRDRAAVIKLTASKNTVEVEEVVVRFGNGEVQHIYELEGRVRDGRSKEFRLRSPRGRYIQSIRVTATAGDLFGSRGRISLDLGTLR